MIGKVVNTRNFFLLALLIAVSFSLSACQGGKGFSRKNYAKTYRVLSKEDRGNIHYKGHYKSWQYIQNKGS